VGASPHHTTNLLYQDNSRIAEKHLIRLFVCETNENPPSPQGEGDKKSAALRIFGRRHFFSVCFFEKKRGESDEKIFDFVCCCDYIIMLKYEHISGIFLIKCKDIFQKGLFRKIRKSPFWCDRKISRVLY